jgi:hypothetical protein
MRLEAQMPYLHRTSEHLQTTRYISVFQKQWCYLTVSATVQAYESMAFRNHVLEGAFSAKVTTSATNEAASSCTLKVEIVCLSTRKDRRRKPDQKCTSFLLSRV